VVDIVVGDLQAVHRGQAGAYARGADLVVISVQALVLFGGEDGQRSGRMPAGLIGDEPGIPERMGRILEVEQGLFRVQFEVPGLEVFRGRLRESEG